MTASMMVVATLHPNSPVGIMKQLTTLISTFTGIRLSHQTHVGSHRQLSWAVASVWRVEMMVVMVMMSVMFCCVVMPTVGIDWDQPGGGDSRPQTECNLCNLGSRGCR